MYARKTKEEGRNSKMMSIIVAALSIIAAIMSFTESLRIIAFVLAIFGIIFAVVSGYQKEKEQNKEKKKSMAIEIGSILVAGAVCISYLILLCIA